MYRTGGHDVIHPNSVIREFKEYMYLSIHCTTINSMNKDELTI